MVPALYMLFDYPETASSAVINIWAITKFIIDAQNTQ